MVNIVSRAVRLSLLGFLMAVGMTIVLSPQALAGGGKKINKNWLGVAIKGYDPVAYFTEGRAVKGKKEFEYKWQDAKWRFSSAANRDKFAADPQAYAPKYGGF
jgi:hypothetical protein